MPTTRADPRFTRLRELGGDRYAAFLSSGYKEWYSPGRHGTPFLLQKCIRFGDIKGIHVNVWVHDFSMYPRVPPIAYSPDVQFNMRSEDGPTFNVELLGADSMSVGEIEAFFERVYEKLGCVPYGE